MRILKTWIGILISGIFLYLAFKKINIRVIGDCLRHTNLGYILIGILFMSFSFLIRALRLKCLLQFTKNVDVLDLFSATTIGFMANNLLPLRMGEIVKVCLIGERQQLSKSLVLATVVMERVFDLLIIFLFFLIILIILPLKEDWGKILYFMGLIYGIIIFCLIGLKFKTNITIDIIHRLFFFLPNRLFDKLNHQILLFAEGLEVFKSPKYIVIIILYSIIIWIISGIMNHIVLLSLKIDLPFYAGFVVLVGVALGIALPSSPGFVGTFHFFCMSTLILLGVKREIALSYALLLHAFYFIPVTVAGFIFLWKENFSLFRLNNRVRNNI